MTGCGFRLFSALVVGSQDLRYLVTGELGRQVATRAERLPDLGAGKLDALIDWMRAASRRGKVVACPAKKHRIKSQRLYPQLLLREMIENALSLEWTIEVLYACVVSTDDQVLNAIV